MDALHEALRRTGWQCRYSVRYYSRLRFRKDKYSAGPHRWAESNAYRYIQSVLSTREPHCTAAILRRSVLALFESSDDTEFAYRIGFGYSNAHAFLTVETEYQVSFSHRLT